MLEKQTDKKNPRKIKEAWVCRKKKNGSENSRYFLVLWQIVYNQKWISSNIIPGCWMLHSHSLDGIHWQAGLGSCQEVSVQWGWWKCERGKSAGLFKCSHRRVPPPLESNHTSLVEITQTWASLGMLLCAGVTSTGKEKARRAMEASRMTGSTGAAG